MYYDGGGVAKSFKEAKKAADKNNSEAKRKLGKMMIKKEGLLREVLLKELH